MGLPCRAVGAARKRGGLSPASTSMARKAHTAVAAVVDSDIRVEISS